MQGKRVPMLLRDPVDGFATIDLGEIEGSVDVSIRVGQISPYPHWRKAMAKGLIHRGRRRSEEVRVIQHRRGDNLTDGVIMDPEALIDHVEAHVVGVASKYFHEKFTILKTGRVLSRR